MDTRRLSLTIVGAILVLAGIVFALQGADVITGSQLMSGNSAYIYIGTGVALIGLLFLALSRRDSTSN